MASQRVRVEIADTFRDFGVAKAVIVPRQLLT